jgi:methanethiol S-methyltransferase
VPGFLRWTGAGLFAASLGYFLFTYAVTFGEIASGPVRPAAVAADVALFSLFALHHSLFARERVRAWIGRRVSPALERPLYVWAASLMLIGVCALWQPIPGVAWRVDGAAAWLLHGVQGFGIWLTLRSAAMIDIWELAGVRTRPPAGDWHFRADGPYGWVRHPIYLGWVLLVFAMPLMTTTRLLFAVITTLYIVIAIPFEERAIRRASGGAYDAYMRTVRWRLVPGLLLLVLHVLR